MIMNMSWEEMMVLYKNGVGDDDSYDWQQMTMEMEFNSK